MTEDQKSKDAREATITFLRGLRSYEENRMGDAFNLPGASTQPAIAERILRIQERIDLFEELIHIAEVTNRFP